MIKAALNGGRTRAEHPNIPITPEELAGSAREAIAAGAACIHFHVRGPDGKESLLKSFADWAARDMDWIHDQIVM